MMEVEVEVMQTKKSPTQLSWPFVQTGRGLANREPGAQPGQEEPPERTSSRDESAAVGSARQDDGPAQPWDGLRISDEAWLFVGGECGRRWWWRS